MAKQNERSQKAAITRAENVERERRENEQLAKETEVWRNINNKDGNRKKAKRVLDSDDEDEDSIAHSRRSQGTSRTKRQCLPPANYDDDEGDDVQPAKLEKHKTPRNVSEIRSRVNHSPPGLESGDEGSGHEGGKEDEEKEKDEDEDEEAENELDENEESENEEAENEEGIVDLEAEASFINYTEDYNGHKRASRNTQDMLDDDFDIDVDNGDFDIECRPTRPLCHRSQSTIQVDADDEERNTGDSNAKSTCHVPLKRRKALDCSSDEENIPPSPVVPRKKAKSTSYRKQTFAAERPRLTTTGGLRSPAAKKGSNSSPANSPPTHWSTGICIMPKKLLPGKKRRLREQPVIIQVLVRHAISQATDDIILKTNWPEESNRNVYGKTLILKACEDVEIRGTYKIVDEVKKRVQTDIEFTKGLCDLVVDRLSSVRAPAKIEAAKHLPIYQLGLGEGCKQRVEFLLKGLRFHFTGSWGGADRNEWQFDPKTSFTHPALIATIKSAFFSSSRAVGYRYVERFSSSVTSKPNEKEIPISLLALCLTGLYSCIQEYRSGSKEDLDFDSTTFLTINNTFTTILKKLQNDRPLDFHGRMHEIFNLVVGKALEACTEDIESAIGIIDF